MKIKNWQVGAVLGVAAAVVASGYASCVSIPKGAKAIAPFDKDQYLGSWYEIARMDFRFEKNLSQVTANYALNPDGSIRVINRGYHDLKKEWKQSTGKAKSINASNEGRLKVSFFGPFYAGYNVIAIDADYRYALVAGNNLHYLWLLSREKTMPARFKTTYLKQARDLGYDVSKLTWTKQGVTPQ